MLRILKREQGAEGAQLAAAIAIGSAIAIGILTYISPHVKAIVDKVITALSS
ncbi:hypothetical protein [Desulfotruncus alcoholivorax]|uniref:hypothetical protein n=1 Tax=Desulfotruncus alcoholivorax TaxID=265477 RepID=UPI0003F54AD3|nr:hypothetical protein [Desulfotruncus alcoholivorax]